MEISVTIARLGSLSRADQKSANQKRRISSTSALLESSKEKNLSNGGGVRIKSMSDGWISSVRGYSISQYSGSTPTRHTHNVFCVKYPPGETRCPALTGNLSRDPAPYPSLSPRPFLLRFPRESPSTVFGCCKCNRFRQNNSILKPQPEIVAGELGHWRSD